MSYDPKRSKLQQRAQIQRQRHSEGDRTHPELALSLLSYPKLHLCAPTQYSTVQGTARTHPQHRIIVTHYALAFSYKNGVQEKPDLLLSSGKHHSVRRSCRSKTHRNMLTVPPRMTRVSAKINTQTGPPKIHIS